MAGPSHFAPTQSVQVHLAHQMPAYNPFVHDQVSLSGLYNLSDYLPLSHTPIMPSSHIAQQMVVDPGYYGHDNFPAEVYQPQMTDFPGSEPTSAHTSLPVSPASPQDTSQVPQLAIRLSRLTHEPMQTIPLQTAPFKK